MSFYHVRRILRSIALSPFELVFKILRIIGFWPSDNWKTRWKAVYQCYTYLVIFSCIIHFASQLLYIAWNTIDLQSRLRCCVVFIPAINSLARVQNFVYKRTQIIIQLKTLRNNLGNISDPKEIGIQKHYRYQLQYITMSICVLYGSCFFIYLLTELIRNSDPAKIWIPLWIVAVLPRWIITTLSIIVLCILMATLVAHAILFSGILLEIAMHLDMLQHRLAIVSMSETKEQRHQHFRECVRHHIFIYEIGEKIQDTFFISTTVQLFTMSAILCVGVFQLMTLEVYSLEKLIFLIYTSATFVKGFSHCWLSDVVRQKCVDIGNAVYGMNWIGIEKSTSKDLMIMMRQSMMRPIVFTGILATPLSVATFRKILNISYQAFAVLRQAQLRRK